VRVSFFFTYEYMGVRALQSFFHECIQSGESFAGIVFERWQAGRNVWRDGMKRNVYGGRAGMGMCVERRQEWGMCVERWQDWECVWRDGRQGRNVRCD
jgi:hypothetical protein